MVECLTTATGVLDYWHKRFFGFFPIYPLWQRHWSHLPLSRKKVNRKGIFYISQSSCQRCRLKPSFSAFKIIITPFLVQLECPEVDFVCPPGSWQTDHNVDCLRDYRNTWIAMNSSSQPGVTILTVNMDDHTDSDFLLPSHRHDISKSCTSLPLLLQRWDLRC